MIKSEINGSFTVKVIRNGEVIREIGRENNLILEGAMNNFNGVGGNLHVGTGTSTPAFGNTSLDNHLAASPSTSWVNSNDVLDGTTYKKEAMATFTFGVGAVVGNLTELGISNSFSPAAPLHTRALFKDGGGNPTVVTVTAVDQLVVTYYIRKHISMVPTVSSVISGGNTINYTIRPCIASGAKAGADARFTASIYKGSGDLYLRVNSANIVTIDGTTYIPTSLNNSGDISPAASSAITLTATGNEVVHTITMPITSANLQWVAGTFISTAVTPTSVIYFQIEFDGPNYITKANTEIVPIKIKEIVNQVV